MHARSINSTNTPKIIAVSTALIFLICIIGSLPAEEREAVEFPDFQPRTIHREAGDDWSVEVRRFDPPLVLTSVELNELPAWASGPSLPLTEA